MELKNFIDRLGADSRQIDSVTKIYPMKVSDYYLSLIREKNDPIWKQCIPSVEELSDDVNEEDPLCEEIYSPVPFLVHRYPDRVLLLVSNRCAVYCRFCTRKRKVGKQIDITRDHITNAIRYIREHKEVRDVIVSGGDPLMLTDDTIEFVLTNLRAISHVSIIRIGTRVPCTLPMRITRSLCRMIRRYHPVFVNVHFEHPREITPESRKACGMLADAGIPLGNQSVLLKGVNDDARTLMELFHKLSSMRVRPYYLYQADQVKGTEYFRTDVQDGIRIMGQLYGHTSGLCVPQYVIDAKGGGKIPILPDYVMQKSPRNIVLRNFEGKVVEYANPAQTTVKREDLKHKMAVVFNLKKEAGEGVPEDFYAEFDDMSVPSAIRDVLEKNGYSADLLEADEELYHKLRKGNYAFVFNIAEGMNGESRESQVPAMLEMLGIPYTGSGVLAMGLTLDKAKTKEILENNRIATAKFQLFNSWDEPLNRQLEFPLFVKPNSEGSSKGIKHDSVVYNENQLRKMLKYTIKSYKQAAIVEEYLEGREFTVSLFADAKRVFRMPILEIDLTKYPDSDQIYTYNNKFVCEDDSFITQADIPAQLRKEIYGLATSTFQVLGCRDFARVDIRCSNTGVPHVIEVNPLPGVHPKPEHVSLFTKACRLAGLDYESMIQSIIYLAMARHAIPNSRHDTILKKLEKIDAEVGREILCESYRDAKGPAGFMLPQK
ncbi:MAG: KamA family radical SAM protein [archaeon]